MKFSNIFWIASQLALVSSKALFSRKSCSCDVNPNNRKDCGYLGINKYECESKGCCWGETDVQGAAWCFYTAAGGLTSDCSGEEDHTPTDDKMCSVDPYSRTDCGYIGITKSECESKGCCWGETDVEGAAWCFNKGSGGHSGTKYQVKKLTKTDNGMKATLDLEGKTMNKYDEDIQELSFEAIYETNERLHIKVAPKNLSKYPHNTDMPAAAYPETPKLEEVTDPLYSFDLADDSDFNIVVKRNDEANTTVFDTSKHEFVFEQQFLQISTTIRNNANIYGFGEVVSSFKRNTQSTRQALWNLDAACPKDQNVYGSHPFYIEIAEDGSAYGVFLKNSHGMDFILNSGKLSINLIGGNFDLYFFMGPTVENVISQYYKVIGQPAFLPYWSLGWHQCRYGYKNIDEVEGVVNAYRKKNLPLDTMWIDIDYMDKFKDFTYDPVNYPISRMKNFVSNLKSNHQYYINMIDPAISTDPNYDSFKRGVKDDIFVKTAHGDLLRGKVWPGETVFPDWHHPNILNYWKNEIKLFKDMAMTDGNWIDMNEAANFCNGACSGSNTETPYSFGKFNPQNPPYVIYNNRNANTPMKYKNLDMDAKYYGGLIEYDIHNIYGHMESIVTYEALRQIDDKKRPFLLSRSTFPGTGKYAAHWLGDNYSTWEYLYLSIPGMLNFQMFGIPMVGSDICGFNNRSDEELCARWMELGAFYPFARNHNAINEPSQEPTVWESVTEASRIALNIRYQILPYWYTLMIRSHTDSGMMVTPLAFEWPTDKTALNNDRQFLVGKGLLVTPVLTQGATSVSGYFPKGVWYDWYDNSSVFSGPTTKELHAPLTKIPLHLRGGYIIPTQGPANTVYENRNKPFGLIVPLDASKKASGEIYLDDGESYDIKGKKTEIKYNVKSGVLSAKGTYNYNETQALGSVKVLGVEGKPSKVTLEQGSETKELSFSYDKNVLTLTKLSVSMNADFTITWA